jgi:hypothetical protein
MNVVGPVGDLEIDFVVRVNDELSNGSCNIDTPVFKCDINFVLGINLKLCDGDLDI